MSMSSRLTGVLLFSTALIAPSLAYAQNDPAPATDTSAAGPEQSEAAQEEVEVSVPGGGGEIVVTGTRDRNVVKSSDQVISVLSTAEIARTGEGNIAGALARVTGLSVVGSGYVYVRGLGDRYSLALLNGSPLPSPEPLKRVVPLDLFPSGVISSSVVQKSYSVNFPGEFGGGVINLTTKSVPKDAFLTVGGSISANTETTGQLGYTYFGSSSDWTGYDNGNRSIPPALAAFFASGDRLSSGTVDTKPIAGQLINSRNAVLQRWSRLPANFSVNFSGGKSFDLGGAELGIIAGGGYSSKWQSRDALQQTSLTSDLSTLESNFRRVSTDQRIVVNGLLGLGLEFGANKVRWTNLYIHDTLKQARLALGQRGQTTVDQMLQDTAWYERQLINSQLVGEFALAPGLKVEVRGSYANSKRKAPFELSFQYVRTNVASDPFGSMFINKLNNGNAGDASVSFSDLNENLWAAGADVSYVVTPDLTATVGGAFSDTVRTSSRRDFQFIAPSSFPTAVATLRPDYLLAPGIINFYGIDLIEGNEANPAFRAKLRNWAGYAKLNAQITSELSLDIGVRYETARQTVNPVRVFTLSAGSTAGTSLDRAYWLPAATLTWQFRSDMQFRLSASKTIARPQFRELIYQPYFDPESNRQYLGNPLLVDSQLYNAEARYEWYFARDQRFSVSGFYKRIDRPIESFVTSLGGDYITSFANAPKAQLYGVEVEAQKFIEFDTQSGFLQDRRIVLTGNYTFTKSKLQVSPSDVVAVFGASSGIATDYFRNGTPLTGQSDHLANLQVGLENTERLSQQTLMLTYASKRVTSRGLNGSPPQPDIFEKPGFGIDFVAREGVRVAGRELELKFEARNLTGQRHEEYQRSGTNRIDINTYDVGRTFSASASVKF